MEYFGLTDAGAVRPTNQDVFRIEQQKQANCVLLLTCDGMGGAKAGNIASETAADRFTEAVLPSLRSDLTMLERQKLLQDGLKQANNTVFWMAQGKPEDYAGMGTTIVAALVQGMDVTLLNVGDSRAYLFDGTQLTQLTEDHSYVNELRLRGKITAEEMRVHPQRNLITRAVGVDPVVQGDLFETVLAPGQILLLCSDGLTAMVSDDDITDTLRQPWSVRDMAFDLVRQALAGGGRDNITVALLRVPSEEKEGTQDG